MPAKKKDLTRLPKKDLGAFVASQLSKGDLLELAQQIQAGTFTISSNDAHGESEEKEEEIL